MAGGIRRVQPSGVPARDASETQAALVMAAQSAASQIAGNLGLRQDAASLARLQAMQTSMARSAGAAGAAASEYYEADLVINDFPQAARYHVTHRETIAQIAERTGAHQPVSIVRAQLASRTLTRLNAVYSRYIRIVQTKTILFDLMPSMLSCCNVQLVNLLTSLGPCRGSHHYQGPILCAGPDNTSGRHQAVSCH